VPSWNQPLQQPASDAYEQWQPNPQWQPNEPWQPSQAWPSTGASTSGGASSDASSAGTEHPDAPFPGAPFADAPFPGPFADAPFPGAPFTGAQQHWQVPEAAPAKRRRTAMWVTVALAVTLVLCGGGGVSAYLLLRDAENGEGAPDPATAVTRFLTAVYTDRDARAANNLVCSEARDAKKISAKVDEVKAYDSQYQTPRFAWAEPSIATETKERAMVSVALTMTTQDEKTAAQDLTFTVVKKTGWWVCEVAG
jgi:hypothetical protein